MDNQDQLNELLRRLNALTQKQESFNKEIIDIRREIIRLKDPQGYKEKINIEENIPYEEKKEKPIQQAAEKKIQKLPKKSPPKPKVKIPDGFFSNIEKFIGENLINKIGILITIIGVAIGAKYSIDNDLISPLTRIILGYLVGLGLLVTGIRLKEKYENYSAVLVSGAIAIMYFITFFAYDFYDLIPQMVAFGLMVLFTIFTVVAALQYDKQVIAHIGLVGAYTVPFLLGDETGSATTLFSYIAIINIGVLAIAVFKHWKALYYTAFISTWLIYLFWYAVDGYGVDSFNLAMIFQAIFFLIFYAIFLAYKLVKKEKFNIGDIIILILNSFIFYGFGYVTMNEYYVDEQTPMQQYLGLFTLANAFIHFIVAGIIYQQKLGDRNLFYFVSGLVLTFITIAIPVQLDGNWVTLLWVALAALVFWIGRSKQISAYEMISYPLMALALVSLLQDWGNEAYNYLSETNFIPRTPVFNISFLTSILFVGAFAFISYWNYKKEYPSVLFKTDGIRKFISFIINAILLGVIYLAINMEISSYFDQLSYATAKDINYDTYSYKTYDDDLMQFKVLWILNFTLLFLTIISFVNMKWMKNKSLGLLNIFINFIGIFGFLSIGLFMTSLLRDSYIDQHQAEYFSRGISHIIVRYISLAFLAGLLFACYRYIKQEFLGMNLRILFDLVLASSILWVASSELIYWMNMVDSDKAYKLGLSIFWGVYSLILIIIGIWKGKKHLRIGAIILFAITLLKLFAYDISHLNTIAKTIIFISLGILLLIISFLYNKYSHVISNEEKNKIEEEE